MKAIVANEVKYPAGVCCLYILRLPAVFGRQTLYKFRITSNLGTRLRTHAKNLQFSEIIFILKCANNEHVKHVENCIKREAER